MAPFFMDGIQQSQEFLLIRTVIQLSQDFLVEPETTSAG